MEAIAERLVDAMNAIHGTHPGFRAVHAKGSCCRGRFRASPQAGELSRAPHFSGDEIAATIRFSSGSGKPYRADGAHDERGMAVKFHLPDGSTTDLVALTVPVFVVRTPEDFLEFLDAQRPDPETGKPDLERIMAFADEHPEAQKALGFVMMTMAPASFAGCSFHSVHAFGFTAQDGSARWGRYRWVPREPAATLTDDETRALGKNYLHDDLRGRLSGGAIDFDLQVQLAEPEDDPADPTVVWPEERRLLPMGRLTIDEHAGDDCEPMVFDPNRLVDGLFASPDPILGARSAAYSVSYERRMSGL